MEHHNIMRLVSESGQKVMAANKPHLEATNYYIMGPAVQQDNGVIEAIYALYYLPVNFKLILPMTGIVNGKFIQKIKALVKENALDRRVFFSDSPEPLKSPEAFASAMFKIARVAK